VDECKPLLSGGMIATLGSPIPLKTPEGFE
jgi:hypothetical protein